MISQDFLIDFLIFWAAVYAIGSVTSRYLGKRRLKVNIFYIELSFPPENFSSVFRPLGRIVGPLFKLGIISLLALSAITFIYMIQITISAISGPKVAGIVPVIPGVTFELSAPVLLSIFIVLVVHEFGHAAASTYVGVQIKKISFFILFLFIGAFVEPDEDSIKRLDPVRRMGIYSSGIFMNILTTLLVVIIALSIFPGFLYSPSGAYVENVFQNGPSYGILPNNVVIKQIGRYKVTDLKSLIEALREYRPGESVQVITDRGSFIVKLGPRPDNPSMAFLGVRLSSFPYYSPIIPLPSYIIIQLIELFYFLLLFNIGLAGLNALPMLPLDGGLVLSELLTIYLGNETLARKLTWAVSAPLALILVYNVLLFFLS